MDKPPERSTENTYPEDRRQSLRYTISGLVEFRWRARNGQWQDAIGITRDTGKAGLFVESESVPPISSALKLTVSVLAGWKKDIILRLSGSGLVRHVRQEPRMPSGFGAWAVFHVEVPISEHIK